MIPDAPPAAPPSRPDLADGLAARYAAVRAHTEALVAGLEPEDFVVQSMPDVSPAKWHLAHTTWFWETFVLAPHAPDYRLHDERYPFLFNSYYVQAGERHCRAQRGYLSRPTVREVRAYRAAVDRAMAPFLDTLDEAAHPALADLIEIGLAHEQQHQELILTDLKHVFSVNPLRPVYRERPHTPADDPGPLRWVPFDAGLHDIGFCPAGPTGAERFHFDNEGPPHRHFLEPFTLADRLVTCADYQAFIADGGYRRPELWLSEGWAMIQAEGWAAPFYWEDRDGRPHHFTLAGTRPVDAHEPVAHLSYYEADAYARWAAHHWPGARLPTEFEWEAAARTVPIAGRFVESGRLHPGPAETTPGGDGAPATPSSGRPLLRQMYGDAWQWTASAYAPYPGYSPAPGALGEYNGKWMVNQLVLRGGSVATPRSHIRPTYRNFFPPAATWQFTGLRLARSAPP